MSYAAVEGESPEAMITRILSVLLFILICNFCNGQTITPDGPLTFCTGGTVRLTSPTGTAYQWQNNGVNIPSATGRNFNANSSGSYTVVVTNNGTPATSDPVLVTVNANPVAAFRNSSDNQCSTQPVSFFDESQGGPYTYRWSFKDPNSGADSISFLKDPVHRFRGAFSGGTQTFQVSLTVTNASGCSNTITKPVRIIKPNTQLNEPGAKEFNGAQYFTKCSPTRSVFNFTYQALPSATNTSYRIIWGDGSPDYNASTLAAENHSYDVGLYNLTFIVSDQNCRDTAYYKVFVGGVPGGGIVPPSGTQGCTGETFRFPFSGTDVNPNGTIYIFSVDDGTKPDTIYHPAPPFYSHTFEKSSCGLPNNSFTIRWQVLTPCRELPVATTPGIYISQKPVPSFTFSRDTACVNTQVTARNTSPVLSSIGLDGRCTIGKIVWSISPATGWTAPGLGSDNRGSIDPNTWQDGAAALNINFTTPGVYTVKMKAGSTVCGIDSITRIICVNPKPTVSFVVDTSGSCSPLRVGITTTTNTPNCGVNSYSWKVERTAAAGCAIMGADYIFLEGNATSRQPVFRFNNAGTYRLTLEVTAPGGACTESHVATITVRSKPSISSLGLPTSVCQAVLFNPTPSIACNVTTDTSFAWSFPGGNAFSTTQKNPGPVVYNSPGSFVISLKVTNSCGDSTLSQTLAINSVPDLVVPTDTVICGEVTVPVLNHIVSQTGTTISWTNNNTASGIPASGTGNLPSFTARNTTANPIVSTIRVTATRGGCSTTLTYRITVNPTPVPPTVTGTRQYCVGDQPETLTATAVTGNQLLWFTTATGGSGNIVAPIPNAGAPGTTNYYVSQRHPLGCESRRSLITVTVGAAPQLTLKEKTDPPTCGSNSGAIVLEGLSPSTSYTIRYLRNGIAVTRPLVSSAAGAINITNLNAGLYESIAVVVGSCNSNSIGPVTLNDPNQPPAPVAEQVAAICSGNTLNLKAGSSQSGNLVFTWTGPNNFTSSQQNPAIPNISANAGGKYYVTVRVNNCVSLADSVIVAVNATPAAPQVSSNSSICAGDSLKLFSNVYTSPVKYSWTGANNFTSNERNPVIANAAVNLAGRYTLIVTPEQASCPSAPAYVDFVIKPIPVISAVDQINPLTCGSRTGSITFRGLEANLLYTATYKRNGGAEIVAAIRSSGNGSLVVSALEAGSYSNFSVRLENCATIFAGPINLVDPTSPAAPAATGNGPLCIGDNLQLNAKSDLPAVSYNWRGPNNFTSTLSNPVINSVTAATSGKYFVFLVANGCTSLSDSVEVLVNRKPDVPKASANSPFCDGDVLQLQVADDAPETVYSWTGPNGFTSREKNPAIPNAGALQAGVYSVVSMVANCASPGAATVSVTIRPRPSITSTSFSNPNSCGSFTGSITLNGLTASSTYLLRYRYNGGNVASVSINSNPAGAIVLDKLPAGVYDAVSVVLNDCRSAEAGPFTLSDLPPLVPSAGANNRSLCTGERLELRAAVASAGGVKYLWTGPSGFSSTEQNPVIPVTNESNGGIYTVTAILDGCSASSQLNIVVSPKATGGFLSNDSLVCRGTNTVRLVATGYTGSVANWQSSTNNGATWVTIANPSNLLIYQNLAVTTWFRARIESGACTAAFSDTTIISVVSQVDAAQAGRDQTICNQQRVNLVGNIPLVGKGKWIQTFGSPVQISSPDDAATTVTGLLPGNNYRFTWLITGPTGCGTSSDEVEISVSGRIAAQIETAPGNRCIPFNLQMKAAGAENASLIQWKIFDHGLTGSYFTATGASASHIYNSPGMDSVRLIVYNAQGCADSVTYRFTVNAVPSSRISPTNLNICSHDTAIAFNSATSYNGSDPLRYQWFVNGVPSGNSANLNYRFITAASNSAAVNYSIRLLTLNAGGCGDTTLASSVSVKPLPPAGIRVSPSTIQDQPDYTFTFEDSAKGLNPQSYLWSMGDRSGQTRSGQRITYEYGDTGTYKVRLRVTDNLTTCSNTDSVNVTIRHIPGYLYVPNAICVGCADNGLRQFLPLGKGLSYYRLRIFTSWGQLIFETTLLNPDGSPKEAWNGTFNNKPIVQDAYRWDIEARYKNNTEWKGMLYPGKSQPIKTGFITVIK